MRPQEILQKFDFYRDGSAEFRHEVLASSEHVSLPAGFHPFQEGSGCPGVAFVGAGDIRVYKVSAEGREVTLYHVGAGQTCLLTLNAALGRSSYPASAVTEAPVEAAVVSAEDFRSWVRVHDPFRAFVFGQMTRRISGLMALIDEVVFRRMDRRVADYLLRQLDSAEAYDRFLEVTHSTIAAELGTAREVVSRVLKELEQEGAIKLGRGRIELVSEKFLRDLVLPAGASRVPESGRDSAR